MVASKRAVSWLVRSPASPWYSARPDAVAAIENATPTNVRSQDIWLHCWLNTAMPAAG